MELISSPSDFFMTVLREASAKHEVRLREATELYLVNLLTEHATATTTTCAFDEPLTFKLTQTDLAEPLERVRLLRETGDTALYVCGFFAESLTRRLLSIEHYMDLGVVAYQKLVRAEKLVDELFRGVFHDLAALFPRLVDVLIEARSRFGMQAQSTTSPLELYEKWRKTGSEHLAQRLRAAGFILPTSGESD